MRIHYTFLVVIALLLLVPLTSGYPTLDHYVNDEVGVLIFDEIYLIENVCMDVETETGAQIAILIVNNTEPDGINMFALKTFEENGLGQEGEDNGLLLVIATGTGEWKIEIGYGLQGTLSAAKVGNIADTYLVPELASGNYFTGIGSTVAELAEEILDNYESPIEPESPYPISWLPLTGFQLGLVTVVIVIMVLTKGQIILWILPFLGKGGKKWGGGRSGGGGAGGKW